MTYHYPAEKRRKLKTELTNQIAPLLASKGFVKKNSCFFRVHGDALLQIIGVVYPHNYTFYVASIVQPMYDFFHPLSTEGTTYHDLIGLRNNHCPDEARAIEYTLELLETGKYLAHKGIMRKLSERYTCCWNERSFRDWMPVSMEGTVLNTISMAGSFPCGERRLR